MNIINALSIPPGASIRQALELMDREGSGICYVVSERRLIGLLTDGDIRRALLYGAVIDDPVEAALKTNFFSLPVNTTLEEIQKHLPNYKYIPIISESGEFIDIATASRYHQIPLVQPVFDGNELEYVTDCITTGWISSQGKYVRQFESDFADYVGCEHALAVSNGTVALHLALVTLGIGPGDEVLVPDLTFAAAVNAVLYVGATPVLVDVEPLTMAIDPVAARAAVTAKTRAIVPVHLYGHPADMGKLMALAEEYQLIVVEDCAEALGSLYQGRHVGGFGHAATFSFYGNKTITTGEGGMVLFQDHAMHARAKVLRDHGMSPKKRYWHDEVGFNYRLTNIQAAIGVAQLSRIEHFVERKRWIASEYKQHLANVAQMQLPDDFGEVRNSFWLYTVVLKPACLGRRDEVLDGLKRQGIEARPVFFPLHRMPPYRSYAAESRYSVANQLADGGISLPSSITVTRAEIEQVSSKIKKLIQEVRNEKRFDKAI